ncbi:unnamed protein product [Oppiella nova]|uniref:Uncharacterized protein n=1 Tax=Oppiella nova TaxID=334625 RepID=A0A7R9QUR9_9ACAR|nr:unnamed protein product [Oppiella nova]CAG2174767.1 unnamed protein product [Oppiella nova]
MSIKYNFEGKVALITGSSSGIGAAIALLFARSGARVVVSGLNGDDISRVAHECSQVSPMAYKPLEVVTDFRIEGDIQRLVDTTVHTFGRLDILVNNAGVCLISKITDPEYIERQKALFDVNLNSVIKLTHLSVKHLTKTNGNIINISSVTGIQSYTASSVYCMVKAAIIMFTQCMATELADKGIRVNCVWSVIYFNLSVIMLS